MESSSSAPPGSVNNDPGAESSTPSLSVAGGNSVGPRHTRGRSRESRGPPGPTTGGTAAGMLGGDVIQVDMTALANVLGENILERASSYCFEHCKASDCLAKGIWRRKFPC